MELLSSFEFRISGKDLHVVRKLCAQPPDYDFELCPSEFALMDIPICDKIVVFMEHLVAGLRFPMPPFVSEFLKHFQLPLYLLHPNSLRFLLGFCQIFSKINEPPLIEIFKSIYMISKRKANGYFFIAAHPLRVYSLINMTISAIGEANFSL